VYFHEFVAQAKRFGLAFLAEADFASMTGADLPEAAREKLDELSGDPVLRGQYLDFVKCRRFRQSLLTRAANRAAPAPVRENVRTLLVASAAAPDTETVELAAGVEVQFRWGQRASLKTDHPLAKTAFLALRERWPAAMSFDELLTAVTRLGGELKADDAATLEQILVAAFGLRMVELTAEPWRAVAEPPPQPIASAIARREAASSDVLTSLMHRRIRLDGPLALDLLRLCDGTRDRRALTDELARLDPTVTPERLVHLLRGLTRTGVLEAQG
jgi:methyltransferase-like protein